MPLSSARETIYVDHIAFLLIEISSALASFLLTEISSSALRISMKNMDRVLLKTNQ